MLSKKLAAVDKTRCVACGVCENTCPLGAVKVRRGFYAAVEDERCVLCGRCDQRAERTDTANSGELLGSFSH